MASTESTGLSPFLLVLGSEPSFAPTVTPSTVPYVEWILEMRKQRIRSARDALAAAEVRQAQPANKRRDRELTFAVGNLVVVNSWNRRSRYEMPGQGARATWLGWALQGARGFPQTSYYKLELPAGNRAHPVFDASKLKSSNGTTQPPSPRAIRLAPNRSTSKKERRRGRG
ncbi:hypothetical protein NBRC10513v2_004176 [Rhodotorula toruloides]|jgi:hypothetical protein